MKPLQIGDLTAKIPVIQGGMGVGVSRCNLAGAVAREGGIGIISTAQIGYDEPDFDLDPLAVNLKAIKKHIQAAKEQAAGGIVGVNIMVAIKDYERHVKAAVEAGADVIISGAGLPIRLPEMVKESRVKIAPIVSSVKATSVMLKMWDRKYHRTADFIVIEGPKAGGHLGFSKEQLDHIQELDFDKEILAIKDYVRQFEEKYKCHIPVISAGGIFTKEDVYHNIEELGVDGVQVATKFVPTRECDASEEYKQAYLNAKKEDVKIVVSPVGMPGRALRNPFIKKMENEKERIGKCFQCLEHCNPAKAPYCITKALSNAVDGHIDNGLIFCGENVYRLKKMSTVKDVMSELIY